MTEDEALEVRHKRERGGGCGLVYEKAKRFVRIELLGTSLFSGFQNI